VAAGHGLPHIGGEGGDEQQGHRGRKVEHRRQQAETHRGQAQADHALDGARKQEGGDDSRNGRRIEHAAIPARAGVSEPAPRPRSLSQEESRGARGPPGFEVRVTATVRRFLLARQSSPAAPIAAQPGLTSSLRRSTAQTASPTIVACGSDCRPTGPD